MSRTLLITNDFPPRPGGIQQFVHNLAIRQPPGSLVVYASRWGAWEKFDAEQPFPVIREDTSVLLPTPSVARRAAEIAQRYDCDRVWFGAAAPLGLLATGLRERAGIRQAVALTHGHEVGWAALPGARTMLRRIARGVDVVTYLGEYTRTRLARAVGDLTTLERLPPGVDTDAYAPVGRRRPRSAPRSGSTDRPVIVCVSRLVPRKGQDTLIRALPEVRRRVPDAALLLVGGGPYRSTLEALAARTRASPRTWSSPVPCRGRSCRGTTRPGTCSRCRAGPAAAGSTWKASGSSTSRRRRPGCPVIGGRLGRCTRRRPSRARRDTSSAAATVAALVERLVAVLTDPALARRLGDAGRAWVEAEWRWDTQADRLAGSPGVVNLRVASRTGGTRSGPAQPDGA